MNKTIPMILFWAFLSGALSAQSNINPDISLIGLFNTKTDFIKNSPEYHNLKFEMPDFELFIDGYLNPYSKAAANISFEGGKFSAEELYAEVLRGLPLDLQIKAGKFLVGFGKINTQHPHAWPFLDRPLFHQVYFGPGGFNDIGVNFSLALPTESFYSNLDLGVYNGDAIGASELPNPDDAEALQTLRGTSPIFSGRLGTFFNLSDYSNLELGLSSSYGIHAKLDFNSLNNGIFSTDKKSLPYLYTGLDFKYKYKPDSYTAFTLQGEALWNHRSVLRHQSFPGSLISEDYKTTINTAGAFIFADYLFSKQFSIGAKYDFTYGIVGDVASYSSLSNDDRNKTHGISEWFSYYPVEETLAVRLGLQHLFFSYADGRTRDPETTVTLQMLFSLGPHKAHPF
ncbi:MAG: hypothetical protein ACM3RX_06220 [Methanococcaceae archaeon]